MKYDKKIYMMVRKIMQAAKELEEDPKAVAQEVKAGVTEGEKLTTEQLNDFFGKVDYILDRKIKELNNPKNNERIEHEGTTRSYEQVKSIS
jgi:hypothetical protein